MSSPPPKHPSVSQEVANAAKEKRYRLSHHAEERMDEWNITLDEVDEILLKGSYEPKKDKFDEEKQAWNYSMRGKTMEKRELRVIVAFSLPDVLVVTTVDLDKE